MTVDRLLTVNGVIAEPAEDYSILDGRVVFSPDFGDKPTDRVRAITVVGTSFNITRTAGKRDRRRA